MPYELKMTGALFVDSVTMFFGFLPQDKALGEIRSGCA